MYVAADGNVTSYANNLGYLQNAYFDTTGNNAVATATATFVSKTHNACSVNNAISLTQIQLSPLATAIDGFYTGNTIHFVSGTSAGKSATISNYYGANQTAILSSSVTVSNNEVQYPKFRGYKEAVTAANTGTAYTLDLSTTNIFDLTLNNNATFTFSNPPSIGTSYSFTIVLHQDSVGSRTVTWPSSAKFTDNTYPILTTTANQVDILTFFTVDGGTRYYGSFAAANTY